MSVTINKNQSTRQIDKKLKELSKKKPHKGIDANAWVGKLNFGIDGLAYQKKIRDEWK